MIPRDFYAYRRATNITSAGEYFLLVSRFIASVGIFSVGVGDRFFWRRRCWFVGSFLCFAFLFGSVLFFGGRYCFININVVWLRLDGIRLGTGGDPSMAWDLDGGSGSDCMASWRDPSLVSSN
jgi:hypothetical protein